VGINSCAFNCLASRHSADGASADTRHGVKADGCHRLNPDIASTISDPHARRAPESAAGSVIDLRSFTPAGPAGSFSQQHRRPRHSSRGRPSSLVAVSLALAGRCRPAWILGGGHEDLHSDWHGRRHEGACRLLAEHVDIRTIQLMLGHADIKQTQRYLNITDEELRKAITGVWERRGQLRAVQPVAAFAKAKAAQGGHPPSRFALRCASESFP
jgi:hypothetical protein